MLNPSRTKGATCASVSKHDEAGMNREPTVTREVLESAAPKQLLLYPDRGKPDTAGATSPPYSSNQ